MARPRAWDQRLWFREVRPRTMDVEEVSTVAALRWAGFAVMAAYSGFVGLILLGYTVVDVGGWRAVGLIAAIGLPIALLCLLAWWRPGAAVPVLAVACLAPVAFGVLELLDWQRWSSWEDEHGPVSLVLLLLVGVALAVLGLNRPREAGVMLLAIVLVPLLLETIGAGSDWGRPLSIAVVFVPVLASGVLFLLAARRDVGRRPVPRGGRLAH